MLFKVRNDEEVIQGAFRLLLLKFSAPVAGTRSEQVHRVAPGATVSVSKVRSRKVVSSTPEQHDHLSRDANTRVGERTWLPRQTHNMSLTSLNRAIARSVSELV